MKVWYSLVTGLSTKEKNMTESAEYIDDIYPVELTCEATICRIWYDLCGSKSHPFMATVRDWHYKYFSGQKKVRMHYDALGGKVRHGSPDMKPSSDPSKRVRFFNILI